MKLTTSKLKNLIKQQIISESQKALGIPHGVDLKENPEVLYDAAMSFIMKNPDLGPNSPNHEDAKLLLRILTNTIQGTVTNREYRKGDMDLAYIGDVEGYIASKGSETSPEETERMREAQGKLKMAKRALENMMGQVYADNGYRAAQQAKRDFLRDNPGYTPGDRDLYEAMLDPTFNQTLAGKLSFSKRVMKDPDVHPMIKDLMSTGNPDDQAQASELIKTLYPEYAKELEAYESPQSSLDYSRDFIHFYHDAKKRAKKEPPGLSESLMFEGDDSILEHFHGATLEEGDMVCEACLFEQLQEASCGCPDLMGEAEYQGRKVTLNKPMRGDVKKFKVYVKDPKTGNVKKVNFGDPNMKIKKSNPKRRKSFRARHNCDNPGPKTKARYWSCKKW